MSVCAALSRTRGDHTDIKMTKTRRPAGDSAAAHVMRGEHESRDELKTFSVPLKQTKNPADVGDPERSGGFKKVLRHSNPKSVQTRTADTRTLTPPKIRDASQSESVWHMDARCRLSGTEE